MRHRGLHIICVSFGVSLWGSSTLAERNLIPHMNATPEICSERPQEPDWMQNIPLRDAYQRVLVQDIYRAQNLTRIVETQTCDCDTRFPSWDVAVGTFQEDHAAADRWEMLQASDTYNRRANELRPQAQAICEAAGNW